MMLVAAPAHPADSSFQVCDSTTRWRLDCRAHTNNGHIVTRPVICGTQLGDEAPRLELPMQTSTPGQFGGQLLNNPLAGPGHVPAPSTSFYEVGLLACQPAQCSTEGKGETWTVWCFCLGSEVCCRNWYPSCSFHQLPCPPWLSSACHSLLPAFFGGKPHTARHSTPACLETLGHICKAWHARTATEEARGELVALDCRENSKPAPRLCWCCWHRCPCHLKCVLRPRPLQEIAAVPTQNAQPPLPASPARRLSTLETAKSASFACRPGDTTRTWYPNKHEVLESLGGLLPYC